MNWNKITPAQFGAAMREVAGTRSLTHVHIAKVVNAILVDKQYRREGKRLKIQTGHVGNWMLGRYRPAKKFRPALEEFFRMYQVKIGNQKEAK